MHGGGEPHGGHETWMAGYQEEVVPRWKLRLSGRLLGFTRKIKKFLHLGLQPVSARVLFTHSTCLSAEYLGRDVLIFTESAMPTEKEREPWAIQLPKTRVR